MLSMKEKKNDIYTKIYMYSKTTYFTKYFTFFPIKDLGFFSMNVSNSVIFKYTFSIWYKKKNFHTTELHYY